MAAEEEDADETTEEESLFYAPLSKLSVKEL
jgi:hypothetical protein